MTIIRKILNLNGNYMYSVSFRKTEHRAQRDRKRHQKRRMGATAAAGPSSEGWTCSAELSALCKQPFGAGVSFPGPGVSIVLLLLL